MRRNGLGATLGGRSVMHAAGGGPRHHRYQRSGQGHAEYLAEEERRVRHLVSPSRGKKKVSFPSLTKYPGFTLGENANCACVFTSHNAHECDMCASFLEDRLETKAEHVLRGRGGREKKFPTSTNVFAHPSSFPHFSSNHHLVHCSL